MSEPLSPERKQEIRETQLGNWYDGPWTQGYVEGSGDDPAYYRVKHAESGTTLATLPDWAGPIALFIADAHDAVPELLAEIDRLRDRITELEALKPARFQDCQTCGTGHEYGQPCSRCAFESQMAALKAAASTSSSTEGDRPELCRCDHTRDRHVEPPGTPICRDCPGDEERSWKHPFAPKGGA